MQFHLFSAACPITRTLMSDRVVPTVEPLRISPWLAMSALQKSIRRADADLATSAVATLLQSDPARLWRRLAGIVVEDIGLADLECIKLVMAVTASKSFRQQFGGDHRVANLVVAHMCEARKCRAADDLFIAVSHHHELEALRGETLPSIFAAWLIVLQSSAVLWPPYTPVASDGQDISRERLVT